MKTILLKFSGPLQSWGTNSNFEVRYTDRYPSKSAVIGMIAASLGYRRDEDVLIQELNKLDFAVRTDQNGTLLRDYHIAYKNDSKENTYVTNRYYLQDAVFVVAIGSSEEDKIKNIEYALRNPRFSLFLGRRSIPLNYDFYLGTRDKNIIDAIKEEKWQAAEWYKKYHKKEILEIYADKELLGDVGTETFIKRDAVTSFSQKRRQHEFRAISKITVENNCNILDEHDAFGMIGGSDVFIES